MSTPENGIEPELEPDPGLDVEGDPEAEPPELTIGFSPRQILGGFVLLAALIALLFRRRRGRK